MKRLAPYSQKRHLFVAGPLQTALAVGIMEVRIESGLLKFDDVGHPLQWILRRSLPEATVFGG